MATLADTLSGRRVYIDANIFIYFLNGSPAWLPAAESLLTAAGAGRISAVTGEAVVAEVMVGPYRARDPLHIRSVREFFAQPGFLEIVPHTSQAWDDAAMLRGTMGVPLVDALHIATAAQSRCDAIVTNDPNMQSALGVEVFAMGALGH